MRDAVAGCRCLAKETMDGIDGFKCLLLSGRLESPLFVAGMERFARWIGLRQVGGRSCRLCCLSRVSNKQSHDLLNLQGTISHKEPLVSTEFKKKPGKRGIHVKNPPSTKQHTHTVRGRIGAAASRNKLRADSQ